MQDKIGGLFEEDQSFSGLISQFNVWDVALSDCEVEKLAVCKCEFGTQFVTKKSIFFTVSDSVPGNVVSWNDTDTDWELTNVAEEGVEDGEFCSNIPDRSFYLLPENRSLEDAVGLCNVMGESILECSYKGYCFNVKALQGARS